MELSRRVAIGSLMTAFAALRGRSSHAEGQKPQPGPDRARIEADADVDRLLPRISNWGRWGPDDQLGTLNFLTPAVRRRAAQGVRSGRLVSLARETSLTKTAGVREGRHEVQSGDGAARDVVGFMPHGFALTHLDGRQHGAALEPGTAIRVRDLEQAERTADVTVSEGDVVLVRTGGGPRNTRERRSGLHPECLPWLHERRIALLGGDGDNDVHPLDGSDRWASAMHSVAIPLLGLPLLDNLELDAVGRACGEERRWTFLFTVAPWRLIGTTASPVNPLALF